MVEINVKVGGEDTLSPILKKIINEVKNLSLTFEKEFRWKEILKENERGVKSLFKTIKAGQDKLTKLSDLFSSKKPVFVSGQATAFDKAQQDQIVARLQKQAQLLPSIGDHQKRNSELMRQWSQQVKMASKGMKSLGSNFDKANIEKKARAGVEAFMDINTQMDKSLKKFKGFQQGFLGLLFFGMALQRIMGGLMTSSWQTFQTITEGTEMAAGPMTRLAAAWEFLKFSIVEAMMNSAIFTGFIEFLIGAIDWVSGLSDGWKRFLGWLTIGLFIIGGLFVGIATLALGFSSILQAATELHNIFTLIKSLGLFTKLTTAATAFKTFVTGKLIPALASAWAVAAPILLIVGIVLAIAWLVMLAKRIGGVGELFKAVGRGIVRVWGVVSQGIADLMGPVFDWMSNKIIDILTMLQQWVVALADFIPGLKGFASRINTTIESLKNLHKISQQGGGFIELADRFNEKFLPVAETVDGVADVLGLGMPELTTPVGATGGEQVNQVNSNNIINIEGLQAGIDAGAGQFFDQTKEEIERYTGGL